MPYVVSMDDNVVVSDSALRLDSQQLVAKVRPDSPVSAGLHRGLVGVLVGLLTLVAFNRLGPWALLIAGVTTAAAVWRADGAGVHDLLSGVSSHLVPGRTVEVRPGDRISTVRVADLRPGDLICPADEFRARMADHDERGAQRAARSARAEDARWAAYERRSTLGGRETPPPAPYGVTRAAPRIRYREVVAVRREHNGSSIRIGLAPQEVIVKKPHDDVLIRPGHTAVRRPDSEPAARALEAVLTLLRHRTSAVPEREVVAGLLSDHHSRPAIRRALRAGVASHLISRHTGFGGSVGRIVRVLTRGPDPGWSGENGHLALTGLGRLWVDTGADPEDRTSTRGDGDGGTITLQTFIVGDHNRVEQTVNPSNEEQLLAIQKLLAAVAAGHVVMTREVTDAVRALEKAVSRGEPSTPAGRKALRTILKSASGGVLIGVVGNAVFTVLVRLAGSG